MNCMRYMDYIYVLPAIGNGKGGSVNANPRADIKFPSETVYGNMFDPVWFGGMKSVS